MGKGSGSCDTRSAMSLVGAGAHSATASGTPWTANELARYARAVFAALDLTEGDTLALNVQHFDQRETVRFLTQEATRRGVLVTVLFDDKRARHKQTNQLVEEGASFLHLQTFSEQRAAPDPYTANSFAAYDQAVADNQLVWTACAAPSREWAKKVYPELEGDAAYHQLGQDLLEFMHQGPDDSPNGFEQHLHELQARAELLNQAGVSSLRLRGEGTDLEIGLLPGSRFLPARWQNLRGREFCANTPTEEIFTTPDPAQVNGTFACSKPLVYAGTVLTDVRGRFSAGELVELSCTPATYSEALRKRFTGLDAGRLGELGLVASDGRIARKDRPYYNTIIDENAGTHLGLGSSYSIASGESEGNQASSHYDVVIGDASMQVVGSTAQGETIEILGEGSWKI